MDYEIQIAETSEATRELTITIPESVFSGRFNKMLSKTATEVRLKGFRPGRAPRAVVSKLYGPKIKGEVLNQLIYDAYQAAVTENSLDVVGLPDISVENEELEGKDIVIKAKVGLYPRPEIKDFEGLKLNVELESLKPEDIDLRAQALREEHAVYEDINDRTKAQDGDVAVVDYSATIDGESFPGSSGTDTRVHIGSGVSIAGIEAALVGLGIGETVSVEVTMPEDAEEKLRGKQALYSLTLKSLQMKTVPELDDDFAKKTGLGESVSQLKEKLELALKQENTRINSAKKEEALLKAIQEKNSFEVPQGLIDEEIRSILFEAGLLDPRKQESYQVNVSMFRNNLGERAEQRVRNGIILSRIIEQLGVSSSEDEVDPWLNVVAEREMLPRAEVDKIYGFPKRMSQLKHMMTRERTMERLLSSCEISISEVVKA